MNSAAKKQLIPRLAFVSGGLAFGGSTTFLCNMGGELVRRGLPVLVVSLESDNPFAIDFGAKGVPVITINERRFIFEDRMKIALRALSKFRPTAVIGCLGPASYDVLRYVPPSITRAGLIQTDHPTFYEPAALCASFMDAIAGVSENIRETVAALPEFQHKTTHYLPYGISVPQTFTPRRSSPNAPLRIIYFGRLQRSQKRVHLFPEILRGLIESGIPFSWSIVGEGEESAFLTENMKTSRPDQQVSFRGKVPYHEVPELLDQNDVFLLPSVAEGLPLSLLEAMAHGLVPVISDLQSGVRELLDGSTGCRVPMDNTSGYAKAMIWLQQNPEEMERMSLNAREKVVRGFSSSAMADRWLAAFPAHAEALATEWPQDWKIYPPMTLCRPIHFSPPIRVFRRLALRMRSFFR